MRTTTCIIGIRKGGKVYIGGDSSAVSENYISSYRGKKVFCLSNMLIGYAGSFRVGQLIQYSLVVPKHVRGTSDMKYLSQTFMAALRRTLRQGGALKEEHAVEAHENELMLGYKGKLYFIEGDNSIIELKDGVLAIGCGYEFALGAVHALKGRPEQRIRKALNITGNLCPGVCGPYYVEKL